MTGRLIYLLLKLVSRNTFPGRYQSALKDWVLIVKLSKKTTKSLSCISMKASINIWLANANFEDANFAAAGSKNTNPSRDSRSSNTASVSSKPTRNLRNCDQHIKHPVFFNMGNTCYANSILQTLSAIPSFWCHSASESGFLSALTRAVTLNMLLLKR